ncbi:MBL fold metallo-hydrolase [Klebsiella oxytoca]|jgi:beta-lactamase superfamily II metal-dependent hydrolase|uniref:MBL fold metallo-hydrolase n=1 Tax=Klebsiella oxytoca TaxID=571 RepID=UPI00192E2564|nr:MBL fold metallo-hydrolase [Klebsiella oxytoca]MBL5997258.1 MBL fold metallo-hydrolase [Klebsiella oxytoca]MBL6213119.1 MBL fold metallo-hydrolase [Klebsiella oxytoca]UHC78441.1 MBL fold metallo-hydrolase [Klebsiella oxytoca]UHC95519.1 MBL fold metallo-hydrolase [Klebsiella oxytoca]HBC6587829.1 MBL fold metallo-hydrolase [Klebsiella oxytoca]
MVIVNILDAGHGDCILLDFTHTLILIDSGPKTFLIRRNVIEKLKDLLNDRTIDIAIVTHNDDDHIGGYEYVLSSGIKIEKFIFNSLSICGELFNDHEQQISYNQDISLDTFIKDKTVSLEALVFGNEPVIINDIKLIPLTPTIDALHHMHDDYIKKNQPQISSDEKVEPTLLKCIEEVANGTDKFLPDRSITNRTSLSLIIEYNGFRGLFLGDAWATDVIESFRLNKIEPGFCVTKLSHHGSERNSNSELINIIGKTEYIICADKSKHNHPNNKTIARILVQYPEAIFHFSSNNEDVKSIFNENSVLECQAECTYSSNGVNVRYYECK